MSTTEGSWQAEVHRIIPDLGDGRARIDRQRVRDLVNTYLVRSLVMAQKIQAALRAGVPLLILDEDRSATNLLVPGCLQSGEVTPLSTLLATRREALGETSVQLPSHLTVLELRSSHLAVLTFVFAHASKPDGFSNFCPKPFGFLKLRPCGPSHPADIRS
jgi:hypothetical protein